MSSQLKTQRTRASVKAFLDGVADESKRNDARAISALMQDITGEKPEMWGTSIVGFSPRKDNLTLYIMPGFKDYADLLGKLGKHKKGMSCLYIKSLDDVHVPTLKTLVRQSVRQMKKIVKERTKEA